MYRTHIARARGTPAEPERGDVRMPPRPSGMDPGVVALQPAPPRVS